MPFKVGAKFKHKNNAIIVELNALGYTSNNLHKLLGCSVANSYRYLQNPYSLTLAQLQSISWAINKPLGYVINLLLCTPAKSSHWLDEDYNPGVHIENLKRG